MKDKIIVLLTLFAISMSSGIKAQQFNRELIEKFTINIGSINPENEDYSDLKPLKKKFKNAEIILLGEQGHGDGSTFEAKSRMVKFLHQEMDFDVLVFESSILDCFYANEQIKKGADPYEAFGKGVFKFWAVSEYTTELIAYLAQQANSGEPLELAGFDMQMSGALRPDDRKEIVLSFLEEGPEAVQIDQLPHTLEYLTSPQRFFKPKAKLEVDSLFQDQLLAELRQVATVWEKEPWAMERAPISRFFVNTPDLLTFIWNLDFQNVDFDIVNIRDRVMAENLIWLKETLYPNQKLIVWGANSHFGYRRDLIQNRRDQMIPMGQYLKDRYQDRSYTLAFTSYDGRSGSIMRDTITSLPPAHAECIESLFHQNKKQYAFLDLQAKKIKKHLNEPFKTRIYGFADFTAQWTQMADGLFFIHTMEPNVAR